MPYPNRKKSDCHYRSNGPPPYHMRFGPRAQCGQSGFPTYRDLLVEDEYGLLVDPEYGGYDINEQDDERSS